MYKSIFLAILISCSVMPPIYSMQSGNRDSESTDMSLNTDSINNYTTLEDLINKSYGWIAKPSNPEPDEIPENLLSIGLSVRDRHFYRPENIASNKLIVAFVYHGTFGQDNESYYDSDNPNNTNYEHIKTFGAKLANTRKQNLELLSLLWKGQPSHNARKLAAEMLLRIIRAVPTYNTGDLVILSHSHGCNIANYLSNIIERPIFLLIHLACPVREGEEYYQPKNYENLLHFYSKADIVAKLGKIEETKCITTVATGVTVWSAMKYIGDKFKDKVICENAPILGRDLNVKDICDTVSAVTAMTATGFLIKEMYGTNDFPAQDGKVTIGFKTRIDGKDALHTEILPWGDGIFGVVEFLPQIIDKVMANTPRHYALSSSFNLNIDTNNGNEDPIYLTLSPKNTVLAPSEIDTLTSYNIENESNKIDTELLMSLRQKLQEKGWFNQEAARYRSKYNKELN